MTTLKSPPLRRRFLDRLLLYHLVHIELEAQIPHVKGHADDHDGHAVQQQGIDAHFVSLSFLDRRRGGASLSADNHVNHRERHQVHHDTHHQAGDAEGLAQAPGPHSRRDAAGDYGAERRGLAAETPHNREYQRDDDRGRPQRVGVEQRVHDRGNADREQDRRASHHKAQAPLQPHFARRGDVRVDERLVDVLDEDDGDRVEIRAGRRHDDRKQRGHDEADQPDWHHVLDYRRHRLVGRDVRVQSQRDQPYGSAHEEEEKGEDARHYIPLAGVRWVRRRERPLRVGRHERLPEQEGEEYTNEQAEGPGTHEAEVRVGHRSHQLRGASDLDQPYYQRYGQEDPEEHELQHVGLYNGPHPAEGRVQDHDRHADEDPHRRGDTQYGVEDRTDREGLSPEYPGADRYREDAGQEPRRAPVVVLHDVADRLRVRVPLEARGNEVSDQHGLDREGEEREHVHVPVFECRARVAQRRSAAEKRGRKATEKDRPDDPVACDREVLGGFDPPDGLKTYNDQQREVQPQKHPVDGAITNDKFCMTRFARLELHHWRRPLRLRSQEEHQAAYLPEHYENAVEDTEAIRAGSIQRAPLGSGLPTAAHMVGGDREESGHH